MLLLFRLKQFECSVSGSALQSASTPNCTDHLFCTVNFKVTRDIIFKSFLNSICLLTRKFCKTSVSFELLLINLLKQNKDVIFSCKWYLKTIKNHPTITLIKKI